MKQRALISVSDKRGIVEFSRELVALGVDIISTGGTEKTLRDAGIPVTNISEVTGFPECLDGRVKTLHPKVHGGILAIRGNESHQQQLKSLEIEPIDFVIINLYPFKDTVSKADVTFEDAIENIDIGGPTMLRSAAKNHKDVVVLVDPSDYTSVIEALKSDAKSVPYDLKFDLALKVFEHTAHYDAMIAGYLRKQGHKSSFPNTLTLTYEKVQDMRYGENPHQNASFYRDVFEVEGTLVQAIQRHGKDLSFNNINDANAAIALIKEFDKPAAVAVKHAVPCGVGTGMNIKHAYDKAHDCDPQSIFGGIVALNRTVDAQTATALNKVFLEVVIAPAYDEDAFEILCAKKNVRVLELPSLSESIAHRHMDTKKVLGGLLVQDNDAILMEGEPKVVTERIPTKKELDELLFAWKVCKHVKSNGIVITKDGQTIGLGQGQVSRVWAAQSAVQHANYPTKGAVLASDAFFPFPDSITAAAKAGITAIIQPGGSVKDQDVIDTANAHGIAMLFTNTRHFKH